MYKLKNIDGYACMAYVQCSYVQGCYYVYSCKPTVICIRTVTTHYIHNLHFRKITCYITNVSKLISCILLNSIFEGKERMPLVATKSNVNFKYVKSLLAYIAS